jgi:hypothetical protein
MDLEGQSHWRLQSDEPLREVARLAPRGCIVWNRIRYTFWAPWYDTLVAAADFGMARQRSIQGLGLQPARMCSWSGPALASTSNTCLET